jgi:hypothetical protein
VTQFNPFQYVIIHNGKYLLLPDTFEYVIATDCAIVGDVDRRVVIRSSIMAEGDWIREECVECVLLLAHWKYKCLWLVLGQCKVD